MAIQLNPFGGFFAGIVRSWVEAKWFEKKKQSLLDAKAAEFGNECLLLLAENKPPMSPTMFSSNSSTPTGSPRSKPEPYADVGSILPSDEELRSKIQQYKAAFSEIQTTYMDQAPGSLSYTFETSYLQSEFTELERLVQNFRSLHAEIIRYYDATRGQDLDSIIIQAELLLLNFEDFKEGNGP